MAKKEMRVCFCGMEFEPKRWNQMCCCPRHARIATRARAGKYGSDLIKNNPQAALRYYSYIK